MRNRLDISKQLEKTLPLLKLEANQLNQLQNELNLAMWIELFIMRPKNKDF